MADDTAALSGVIPIKDIADDRNRIVEAVLEDYAQWRKKPARFVGYTLAEIDAERDRLLREIDHHAALSTLATLEALFQLDYQRRCRLRLKDPLTRHFRSLDRKRNGNVRFSEDILDGWKRFASGSRGFIGEINAAFHYRHWLAHGRYWVPRFGRKFDYDTIYDIAHAAQTELGLST